MELPMSREERAAEMARREVHREQTKTIFRALMVAELGAQLFSPCSILWCSLSSGTATCMPCK